MFYMYFYISIFGDRIESRLKQALLSTGINYKVTVVTSTSWRTQSIYAMVEWECDDQPIFFGGNPILDAIIWSWKQMVAVCTKNDQFVGLLVISMFVSAPELSPSKVGYVRICVYKYICTVYIYIHIYIHLHTCTYIYIYIYTYRHT